MVAELGSVRREREVEVRLGLSALWFARLGCRSQPHPGWATALQGLRDEQPPHLQGRGPSAPLTLPGCSLSVQNRMYVTHLMRNPRKRVLTGLSPFPDTFISRYLTMFSEVAHGICILNALIGNYSKGSPVLRLIVEVDRRYCYDVVSGVFAFLRFIELQGCEMNASPHHLVS